MDGNTASYPKIYDLEKHLEEAKTLRDTYQVFASVLRHSNTSSSSPSPSRHDGTENNSRANSPEILTPAMLSREHRRNCRESDQQLPLSLATNFSRSAQSGTSDPEPGDTPFLPNGAHITDGRLTGELGRRSVEKAVAKASSHLRARHLLHSKELMVPSDPSCEVYRRGLSLHQTLCPSAAAALSPQHSREGTSSDFSTSPWVVIEGDPHFKFAAVFEPESSVVPLYRGINEEKRGGLDERTHQERQGQLGARHYQQPTTGPALLLSPPVHKATAGKNCAGVRSWPASLSPIISVSQTVEDREDGRHTPLMSRCSVPPHTQPLSSTPLPKRHSKTRLADAATQCTARSSRARRCEGTTQTIPAGNNSPQQHMQLQDSGSVAMSPGLEAKHAWQSDENVSPQKSLASNAKLDYEIQQMLERSGKKLREVRNIVTKSREDSFQVKHPRASSSPLEREGRGNITRALPPEHGSRSTATKVAMGYGASTSDFEARNVGRVLSRNVYRVSPMRNRNHNAGGEVEYKGREPSAACYSLQSERPQSHGACTSPRPQNKELESVIRSRSEALKELTRARLYLIEEERLCSQLRGVKEDNEMVRQKSDWLMEKYKRRKQALRDELARGNKKLGEEERKQRLAEHYATISAVQAETLVVQRRVQKLQARRHLAEAAKTVANRGVQVPSQRGMPPQIPRQHRDHNAQFPSVERGLPLAEMENTAQVPMNGATHSNRPLQPAQQHASRIPVAVPILREEVVPRLDLRTLSQSPTYHSSQYVSQSELADQEGSPPLVPLAQLLGTQYPLGDRSAAEALLALVNPPDSAKTSEGVSSIRDESVPMEEIEAAASPQSPAREEKFRELSIGQQGEWMDAKQMISLLAQERKMQETRISPGGIGRGSPTVKWVPAAEVVIKQQSLLEYLQETQRIGKSSVKDTDNDASPIPTDTPSLPLGSLVSPSPEPPKVATGGAAEAKSPFPVVSPLANIGLLQPKRASPAVQEGQETEEPPSSPVPSVFSELNSPAMSPREAASIVVESAGEEGLASTEEGHFANDLVVEAYSARSKSSAATSGKDLAGSAVIATVESGDITGTKQHDQANETLPPAGIEKMEAAGENKPSYLSSPPRRPCSTEGRIGALPGEEEAALLSDISSSPTYYSSSETPRASVPESAAAERQPAQADGDGLDAGKEKTALEGPNKGDSAPSESSCSLSEEVPTAKSSDATSSQAGDSQSAHPNISTIPSPGYLPPHSPMTNQAGESSGQSVIAVQQTFQGSPLPGTSNNEKAAGEMETRITSPVVRDLSTLMGQLSMASEPSTCGSMSPRSSGHHMRRTPRSPTDRYMAKYPSASSPRLLPISLSPISPAKLQKRKSNGEASPGGQSPQKVEEKKEDGRRKKLNKGPATAADFFFASSSDEEEEYEIRDKTSSTIKMLDELPNISSLTPILDISKSSLESPGVLCRSLPSAFTNNGEVSELAPSGKDHLRLNAELLLDSEIKPAAIFEDSSTQRLFAGEDQKIALPAEVQYADEIFEPGEEKEVEEGGDEEAELSCSFRDAKEIQALVRAESTKIWARLQSGDRDFPHYHNLPTAADEKENQAEADSNSSSCLGDFHSMVRDWCWELVADDLAIQAHNSRQTQARTSQRPMPLYYSAEQVQARLESIILPTICFTSSPISSPALPHGTKEEGGTTSARPGLVLDAEAQKVAAWRLAVRQRAEGTSHLLLDAQRLLALRALYGSEQTWCEDEVQKQEIAICQELLAQIGTPV